jgi:hypothetical protein
MDIYSWIALAPLGVLGVVLAVLVYREPPCAPPGFKPRALWSKLRRE